MEDTIFDQAAYFEYMTDLNYSQGFYVTPGKDGSVLLGGIRRVEENSGERYLKALCAAEYAVAEHNRKVGDKNKFLLLREIRNLNVEPTAGAIYYITADVVEKHDINRYEMKIWEKLHSGYQVQIFRPAPYWFNIKDRILHKYNGMSSRIRITGLLPWMDENYLYYKCFSASPEVLGVKVVSGSPTTAYIWFTNSLKRDKIVNKYKGRKMPQSNIFYTVQLTAFQGY